MQSQWAVTVYLGSKQLLPSSFEQQKCYQEALIMRFMVLKFNSSVLEEWLKIAD